VPNYRNNADLPLSLIQSRVDSDRGEVTLPQKPVKLGRSGNRLDENANLVELEVVQQVVQLPVLLTFRQLDEVLLQTVQGQLSLVVNVNLEGLR
jgi:hypothetical protein